MNTQSIISVLSGDKLFNGFGANHSVEALFYARIHPLATTSSIFNDEESLHRLLKGLHMASRLPRHWNKYISKSPNLNSTFEFNNASWNYYNKVNKVYTKEWVLVEKSIYEEIVQDKQVIWP